ncbi:DUF4149 domain-containing protein [Kaustia mangrovi]|uniref:DUF4149 domain-containing protein n=1 Tax=Kaustia mangrovi TaxID=2593653 RepID=A0A7S8HBZ9_9HYPH|nr:DUF4149 domain-containing protein [Kaustia mangrovi]QPC43110.1 DUF4149 domain-containing protein [Kaustia mangrovi]
MAPASAPGPWPRLTVIGLVCLWAGLVIGVSFLATPVKFGAEGLDRPVALDIGRITFAALNIAEWGLAALLALVVVLGARTQPRLIAMLAIIVILLLQTSWLLPALDERTAMVIAGKPLEPSIHHMAYGILEIAKVVALIAWAGLEARLVARGMR